MEAFLAPRLETGSDEPSIAFAGYVCDPQSRHLGCDSLNKELGMAGEQKQKFWKRLRQQIGKDEYLHYKGGTVDGFTGTIYLCVSEEVFVIVLSNCTGPLDFSEPVARSTVQEILFGKPPSDLASNIQEHLKAARSRWRQLELENENHDNWQDEISRFYGTYKDNVTKRSIEITNNKAIFQVGDKAFFRTPVVARGNCLRLLPNSCGLFVDRITFWQDLTFELIEETTKVVLVGRNGSERYIKLD